MSDNVTPIKAWQKGTPKYVLDALKETYDEHYNKFARSPFNEMNAPALAKGISDGTLRQFRAPKTWATEAMCLVMIAKQNRNIYCLDNFVGCVKPGDVIVRAIAWNETTDFGRNAVQNMLTKEYADKARFVDIWEEDKDMITWLLAMKFTKICTKVRSTSEIIGTYFKQGKEDDVRRFNSIPELERTPLRQISINFNFPAIVMAAKFSHLPPFQNHYSNYNKNKSWSALSLRGFDADPNFIEKPEEVMKSKKWADKYAGKEFKLQNTALMNTFAADLEPILKVFGPWAFFERIRFMKLAPNAGELERHTDLQDTDMGTLDGKIMRFHVPIISNPQVYFSAWDYEAQKQTVVMKTGTFWMLDTRYPHTIVNKGTTERVHLVIDVHANEYIRNLVLS